MIKIFFHVACMNYFGDVKNELIAAVRAAGLEDAADEIHVNLAGKCRVLIDGKWREHVTRSDLSNFEFPTLENLWDNAKPDDKILYIHTKGVANPSVKEGTAAWRRYMIWGVVERWRECVAALDDHDAVGVLLIDKPGRWAKKCGAKIFYGGNFWWARGDYVKRLARPDVDLNNRWKAEGWIMTGQPRAFCLHNISGGRLVTAKRAPGYFSFHAVRRSDYDPNYKQPRNRVKSRIEIINRLIEARGYKSYCEIGVWRHDCFKNVACARKVSVDPAAMPPAMYPVTSDRFFAETRETFDIFFLDGLHTEAQVFRDIENALTRLNPGGVIVVHDCNPETEFEQRDTPDYDGDGVWVGTVWRAFARLRMTRTDLKMGVVDTDFGCGIIERGQQETFPERELTYPIFVQNRERLMNAIQPEDFETWIKR